MALSFLPLPTCIVLCSDGTGNKGGYGDDSNVFKLYNALERGRIDQRVQLTFYDNGVGTDDNRLLRAVSGAFGLGFRRNVRNLYAYLARHYHRDVKIYAFGFSRGAATVRALLGMVQVCGLVHGRSFYAGGQFQEEAFQKKIDEALCIYEKNDPESDVPPEGAAAFKQGEAVVPVVAFHFLGVWDTVSALGFPSDWSWLLSGFFDGLDRWSDERWPHRFYTFRSTQNTKTIRHALAIDDERTTFHPKLFNERRKGLCNNLEQVWFAGVHANVGGGYPRAGLSDVALHWMMCCAAQEGLRFRSGALDEVANRADVQGELFDSRGVLGIYYRYKPRDIKKIHGSKLDTGGAVLIHDTVLERMARRADDYAPGYLPCDFEIVQTPVAWETTEGVSRSPRGRLTPATPEEKQTWADLREELDRWVNKRGVLYRWLVESSLVMFILAGWHYFAPVQHGDLEGISKSVAVILRDWVPGYFKNFTIYIFAVQPVAGLLLVAFVVSLYVLRSRWRRRTQAAARALREFILLRVWPS